MYSWNVVEKKESHGEMTDRHASGIHEVFFPPNTIHSDVYCTCNHYRYTYTCVLYVHSSILHTVHVHIMPIYTTLYITHTHIMYGNMHIHTFANITYVQYTNSQYIYTHGYHTYIHQCTSNVNTPSTHSNT